MAHPRRGGGRGVQTPNNYYAMNHNYSSEVPSCVEHNANSPNPLTKHETIIL